MSPAKYPIFSVAGLELEFMIVNRDTLEVQPISDTLLQSLSGYLTSDAELGPCGVSNELVAHVIEIKTLNPEPWNPLKIVSDVQGCIQTLNQALAPLGSQLMATAMHPWMNPRHETRLWPHAYSDIYRQLDAIFDCKRHGWANLQSAQLNLPFSSEAEFIKLHAACRVILPLIPGLAASSPFMEGAATGWSDTRLNTYRSNCEKVPSLTGAVIPEPMASVAIYHLLLKQLMVDISPHLSVDAANVLTPEHINARGVVARFDRHALELRVTDMQECVLADVAISHALIQVLRGLVAELWQPLAVIQHFSGTYLKELLLATARQAEHTPVENSEFLAMFGLQVRSATVAEIWQTLIERLVIQDINAPAPITQALVHILEQGTLATRMLKRVGSSPDRASLKRLYQDICVCGGEGTQLHA